MTCIACGERRVSWWRSASPADRRASRTSYPLLRCAACGTAVTSGRSVSDAEGLYEGGSYAPARASAERFVAPLRRAGERAALRSFAHATPGAAVLEIGSGDGWLVSALRARGCRVTAVEPFSRPTVAGISPTPFEEAAIEERAYHVVVFWHVLEHLDDPLRALRRAARALEEGGRIVISVPVLDSVQSRLGGDRWFHQDVPRHAVHFTRTGIVRILERAGLDVVQMRSFVPDQNFLGMTQTLLNLLTRERNVGFRLVKGEREPGLYDRVISVVALPPVVVLGCAVETAAMAGGRGGSVILEAMPKE